MKTKKLLALALSTMMIFAMGTTSFADEASAFKNPLSPIPEGPQQYTIINGNNSSDDHVVVGYNSANRVTTEVYNFYKPYFA